MKASLPSSYDGLNLHSALLHTPAAFLDSKPLAEKILGHPVAISPHISAAVVALAMASAGPDWQCLDDLDAPLQQHTLSVAVDKALHNTLPISATSACSQALVLSL